MRVFLGLLLALVAVVAGSSLCWLAVELADSFPPNKTFGQNSALFAIYFVGLSATTLIGDRAARLLFRKGSR